MANTYVHINNIRIRAYHGVLPQERIVGNDYVVNIKVGFPWIEAAETDDVSKTLNYASLAELLKREMAEPVNLVETVAYRIVKAIQRDFPQTTSIRLKITKIAPPMNADCDGAGVEINYP